MDVCVWVGRWMWAVCVSTPQAIKNHLHEMKPERSIKQVLEVGVLDRKTYSGCDNRIHLGILTCTSTYFCQKWKGLFAIKAILPAVHY